MPRKVAVLVGSLRNGSFTRAIAEAIAEVATPRLECQFIEIGDLPLYNPDLDMQTPPTAWSRLRREVSATEAVLFATPEYNRSMPGALKNALDVGSRPYGKSVWNRKPAAVVSVAPGMLGAFGANHHLRQPLVFLNMPIMQQPEAYISKVSDLLDDEGRLTRQDSREFLMTFANAFADWIDLNANAAAEPT